MNTFVHERESLYFTPIDTPFGSARLIWGGQQGCPMVYRLSLPAESGRLPLAVASGYPGAALRSCVQIDTLIKRIGLFFQGDDIVFPLEILALNTCTAFQQAVLRSEHVIPRGRVSTYGRLARRVGSPGAARAVGQALSKNPFPILIPCHRALRSDGHLGGFQGGLAMKRSLLEMEGVMISPAGKVINARYYD